MSAVNIRELARRTSRVVDAVHRSRRAALVTRGGRPIVAIIPLDEDALDDWILTNNAPFVASLREANADLRRHRALSLDDFIARNPSTRRAPAAARTGARAPRKR